MCVCLCVCARNLVTGILILFIKNAELYGNVDKTAPEYVLNFLKIYVCCCSNWKTHVMQVSMQHTQTHKRHTHTNTQGWYGSRDNSSCTRIRWVICWGEFYRFKQTRKRFGGYTPTFLRPHSQCVTRPPISSYGDVITTFMWRTHHTHNTRTLQSNEATRIMHIRTMAHTRNSIHI